MATTALIPHHIGKGRSILSAIQKSLDYGKNPDKTRDGELISSYECNPKTADLEFILSKNQYKTLTGRTQNKKNDILMYQIRQSFLPGTISPEEANRLSYELAKRFTKGNHAFIVATHEDKAHIHSHIYFNSTALDCTRKFKNFWGSTFAVRRLSDQICIENGLSVIKSPKPSRGHYGTWLGDKKAPSNRDIVRGDIDEILLQRPKDFEEFLAKMKLRGYEIKNSKRLTFLHKNFKKPIRCDSLKDNYTEHDIRERIKGASFEENRNSESDIFRPMESAAPFKVGLIIEIEKSIKAKNSPGYEHWAKVFNLKQAAQTLIYLQENKLDDYEKLEKKLADTSELHQNLLDKMKPIEKRLSEIKELEKQIGIYGKTKEVYAEYRKLGYKKKFLAEHESKIILHRAAKKYFDGLGLEKLPPMKKLKTEYAALKSEKGKLYNEYRKAKEEMKKLNTVKFNTDRLLNYSRVEHDFEHGRVRQ